MKKGDLFYWHKTILCEYIGLSDKGQYMFQTSNGGIIKVSPDELTKEISDDKS